MTDAKIDIRTASEADIPVLAHARRLMFEEIDDFGADLLDRVDSEFVPYMEQRLAEGSTTGWIAFDCATDAWVGAVAVDWIEQPTNPKIRRGVRALLFGLYVKPAYRRSGVARALVRTAVEAAREAGAGAVQLHASEFGRPLYESLGFRPTTEMRLILEGGETPGGSC